MIKKMLFVIILLFPMFVLAEEENKMVKDEYYIEEAEFKVRFLDKDKIMMEENYKTRLIYGTTSQTYFFTKPLHKSYTYTYKNKEYSYNTTTDIIKFDGDTSFSSINNDNYVDHVFGLKYVVLKEVEYFEFDYNVTFEKKTNNIYSYVMGNNPYETKKITFEIVAPFTLKDKELYFSLDGKNYSKEIEGLSLTTEADIRIKGVYDKPLEKDKGIYFLMYDPLEEVIVEESTNNNNVYLIVGGLVILFGLSAYIIIKKAKK